MNKKITAFFPPMFSFKKTTLSADKISNGDIEISLRDITKIVVQPKKWLFFLYQTNDIKIYTNSMDGYIFLNLSNGGLNEFLLKAKDILPSLLVNVLEIKTGVLINGLVRTREF